MFAQTKKVRAYLKMFAQTKKVRTSRQLVVVQSKSFALYRVHYCSFCYPMFGLQDLQDFRIKQHPTKHIEEQYVKFLNI
jgi:hypothetical protein